MKVKILAAVKLTLKKKFESDSESTGSSNSDSDSSGDEEIVRLKGRKSKKGVTKRKLKKEHQRRVNVPPPVFKETDDWNDFIIQFDLCAKVNKWSDEQKAAQLCAALRGSTKSCLSLLGSKGARNYKKLVSALSRQYAPTGSESRYGSLLMRRSFRGNKRENLPHYLQSLKKLYVKAYGQQKGSDRVICDLFIRGLPNELRKLTSLQRPQNCKEALDVALSVQAATDDVKGRIEEEENISSVQTGKNRNNRGFYRNKKSSEGKGSKENSSNEKKEEIKPENNVAAAQVDEQQLQQVMQSVKQLVDSQNFLKEGQKQLQNDMQAIGKRFERKPMSELICRACGEKGHIQNYCPKRNQYAQNNTAFRGQGNMGNRGQYNGGQYNERRNQYQGNEQYRRGYGDRYPLNQSAFDNRERMQNGPNDNMPWGQNRGERAGYRGQQGQNSVETAQEGDSNLN